MYLSEDEKWKANEKTLQRELNATLAQETSEDKPMNHEQNWFRKPNL